MCISGISVKPLPASPKGRRCYLGAIGPKFIRHRYNKINSRNTIKFEHYSTRLMRKFFRFILILLSVATGALFLYSAYTKLFPILAFEYTMVEFVHLPLWVAAIAARFFIGLEAALGALITFHLFGKNKWALKVAFILLVVFSGYLIYLWIKAGNDVNCGCFGDTIWMSPSTSLIKNAILLAIAGMLIRYHHGFTYRWAGIAGPALFISILILPYIIFPLFKRYKLDFQPIYTLDKSLAPAIDLSKGKHIIAFLSPSCIHCRKAAFKMHQMEENNPAIPFYMIIVSTMGNINGFWEASQAQNVPYTRLAEKPFMKYTGGVFPQIFWVNNGWVEESTSYPDLDQKVIEKWMK